MWVELEDRAHQRVWHIGLNPGPAPILSVSLVKSTEDYELFHHWIRTGFRKNVLADRPRWFITASNDEWGRRKHWQHYKVSSLRAVLDVDFFNDHDRVQVDESCAMELELHYANNRFAIYELTYFEAKNEDARALVPPSE